MVETQSVRARRCRSFLRILSAGGSVTEACKASGCRWATLYKWRRKDAAFRAAWDEAVAIGDEARIARLDDEMMRRAVDGTEDPVIQNGEQVAIRKRYSDALLMFAIRELRGRRKTEPPPEAPRAPPSAESKITVVVRQFGAPVESAAKENGDG